MNKQNITLNLQEIAAILDSIIKHEEHEGRKVHESDIILNITKHDSGLIDIDVTVNPLEEED